MRREHRNPGPGLYEALTPLQMNRLPTMTDPKEPRSARLPKKPKRPQRTTPRVGRSASALEADSQERRDAATAYLNSEREAARTGLDISGIKPDQGPDAR